jgi:hypothetical protein
VSQYMARWQDGFEVVWRNLTWSEYREFKARYDKSMFDVPMDIAIDIYSTVYIKGPDPKFVPAGIPGYICQQQMQNNPYSGRFEDIAPAINMGRMAVSGNYLLCAKALIASVLNYKPEEIDNWDPNTFFLRLAQTEVASGRTFDPVDPKAIPADSKTSAKKSHRALTPQQEKAIARTEATRSGGNMVSETTQRWTKAPSPAQSKAMERTKQRHKG